MPEVLDALPDTIPAQYKEIPYFIMARMAADGHRSVEDLTDRWSTITEARSNAPADLQFRHTDRGRAFITQEKTNHLAMRISQ